MSFLEKTPVYQFDPKKVTTETLDGHPVLAYEVTYNTANLQAYNLKVAALMGLSQSDISLALDSFGYYGKNKVYIERDTKHLAKVEYEDGGGTVTVRYVNYSNVMLPVEPVASLRYDRLAPPPAL
ncbi:MAG: hypothetical protein JWN01_1257 [Patescibacteria group bacterium]|nr:hypothetical protein [Patescibacteria group bacterium]